MVLQKKGHKISRKPVVGISGKWMADGSFASPNSTLEISNKDGCKVVGFYDGKDASLRFEGMWDKGLQICGFKGRVTNIKQKCEIEVVGILQMNKDGNLYFRSLTDNPTKCPHPDELNDPTLVFVRKA
jgi:hypothetical protein